MIIHKDKLRWLFWLRWKMLLRGFIRNGKASEITGTIFQALFSVIFMGGIAVVTGFLYRFLPAPANMEILYVVLTGLLILWIVLPFFDIARNEGLDLSKLSLYPLTRAEIIVSLLLSTVFDLPMLGLFLILAAVVYGWSGSLLLALFTLLTVLLFAILLIGLGQLVVALFQSVLHNRRFRDLRIFLTFGIFILVYFSQFAFRALASTGLANGIHQGTFSNYLRWFPSGVAAYAIEQANAGNWGMGFLSLLLLAVIGLLVLYLWLVITQRGLASAEENGARVEKVRTIRRRRSGSQLIPGAQAAQPGLESARPTKNLLPQPVITLAIKDLKYVRRDPQITRMFLQSLVIVVFYVFYFAYLSFGSTSHQSLTSDLGPWIVVAAPALILLSLFVLTYNVLGFERQSLTTLFLFPTKPIHILWAKNLVAFTIGLVEMLILIILAAFVTKGWLFVIPALALGIAGMGIQIGLGNLTSVIFPQRMRLAARGFGGMSSSLSSNGGCLRAVMSGLAFYGTMFALVPVALAIILPVLFGSQWLWVLTVPATLLYGGGIYYGVTRLIAPRMLKRAPELLEVITKE